VNPHQRETRAWRYQGRRTGLMVRHLRGRFVRIIKRIQVITAVPPKRAVAEGVSLRQIKKQMHAGCQRYDYVGPAQTGYQPPTAPSRFGPSGGCATHPVCGSYGQATNCTETRKPGLQTRDNCTRVSSLDPPGMVHPFPRSYPSFTCHSQIERLGVCQERLDTGRFHTALKVAK
jgi:hypothetical protein